MSDDAWFYYNGYSNSHNNDIQATVIPQILLKIPVPLAKVRGWCAISWQRVFESIFIDTTATSIAYVETSL